MDYFTVYAVVLLRFIPIADANDEAQFGELYVQLDLPSEPEKHGVRMTACIDAVQNLTTSKSYTRAATLRALNSAPHDGASHLTQEASIRPVHASPSCEILRLSKRNPSVGAHVLGGRTQSRTGQGRHDPT